MPGQLINNQWLWEALKLFINFILACGGVMLVLTLSRRLLSKLPKRGGVMYLKFVENILRAVIILLAFQWVIMSSSLTSSFGRVLFQGTAIIGAIAGLAAQPVISDLICGLMISAAKPFDIGDRVELEDGTAGIIKDVTMRHVVIETIDTQEVVIPNSKLNAMRITNMSYHTRTRSVFMEFHVSYDTDVEFAQRVILRAVQDSPYTIPGKPSGGERKYAPVYFTAFAESSLVLATTIYFEPVHETAVVKNDVNIRVKHALEDNHIEIPYSYVNVVMPEPDKAS